MVTKPALAAYILGLVVSGLLVPFCDLALLLPGLLLRWLVRGQRLVPRAVPPRGFLALRLPGASPGAPVPLAPLSLGGGRSTLLARVRHMPVATVAPGLALGCFLRRAAPVVAPTNLRARAAAALVPPLGSTGGLLAAAAVGTRALLPGRKLGALRLRGVRPLLLAHGGARGRSPVPVTVPVVPARRVRTLGGLRALGPGLGRRCWTPRAVPARLHHQRPIQVRLHVWPQVARGGVAQPLLGVHLTVQRLAAGTQVLKPQLAGPLLPH
jgi:hypothetical protein